MLKNNYSDFIARTLKESSKIANKSFGKVSGFTKTEDNNQVLTKTDLEIGKFIISKINQEFPTYNIIDEEAGVVNHQSEFTWVVDPIDGTSNFAQGVPTYGIMIGLLKNSTAIAGGIALPYFSQICLAEKGKGAFINNQKIKVSQEKNLLKVLVAYGIDGHQENPDVTYQEIKLLSEIILAVRNLRTSNSVFDAVMTASGRYGAFLNKTSKIWDNVAQQIIIEEAGGVYTDFFGKPINYSNPLSKINQNFNFCTAPPILHKQLQMIIHKFQ